MSWASDDPEAYSELEVNAIRKWLVLEHGKVHGDDDFVKGGAEVKEGVFGRVAEVLYYEHPTVRDAILDAGASRLVDETEYFDKLAV